MRGKIGGQLENQEKIKSGVSLGLSGGAGRRIIYQDHAGFRSQEVTKGRPRGGKMIDNLSYEVWSQVSFELQLN